MKEELEETKENDNKTAEDYLDPTTKKFKKGNPGGGRPKDTPQSKIVKKAIKELVIEYKQGLAEALPFIRPVLVQKASEGDIQAIKEVNDRVMGKSPQSTDITSGGDKIVMPILGLETKTPDVSENDSNTEDTATE